MDVLLWSHFMLPLFCEVLSEVNVPLVGGTMCINHSGCEEHGEHGDGDYTEPDRLLLVGIDIRGLT